MTTKKAANTLLKQARQERGWTQRHLAFELHVEEQTVRSWERGIRSPSLEIRPRLCEVLGKSSEQLGLQAAEANEIHNEKHEEKAQIALLPSDPVFLTDSSHQEFQHAGSVFLAMSSLPRDGVVLEGDKNRQRMLKRVQMRWITDVLEHSLYQKALILLSLREEPEAVENPWRNVAQESAQRPGNLLPVGSHISQVYDDADGELLILGEPGAGKTTLLLALTHALLARARRDEQHPLPIIFNLSEWVEKRQSLQGWLVQELHTKYQVPLSLAQTWIENERIVLLLDGLDEVVSENRTACTEAINAYREIYGLVPIVVCSRIADYLAQPTRLLLNRAVVVQPLTMQQTDEYIKQAGTDLAALQLALHHDPALQEMASTPLMLNTLTATYQGMAREEALIEGNLTRQRHHIFDKFVERVLERRGPKNTYTIEQTTTYLGWLAQGMQQHNQTEFYIERLQPDWFMGKHRNFRKTIIRIVLGLSVFVDSALYACFRGDSVPNQPGLFYWLGGNGVGNSILGWMQYGLAPISGLKGAGILGLLTFLLDVMIILIVRQKTLPTFSFTFFYSGIKNGIRQGLVVGVLVAILYAIAYGAFHGLVGILQGIISGFWAVALVGMVLILKDALQYGQTPQRFDEKALVFRRTPTERLIDFFSMRAVEP